MSLRLEGVNKVEVVVNTWDAVLIGDPKTVVTINGRQITMEEFRHMVAYVMCNTRLQRDDQRLELLEDLRSLSVVEHNGQRYLEGPRPIIQAYKAVI